MSSRAIDWAGRLILASALAVSGCGVRQVGEGAAPEGKARFPEVAVVTLFTSQGRAGGQIFDAATWDAGGKAARIVTETLSAAGGATVTIQMPVNPSDSPDEPDWADRAVAAARVAGHLPPGLPVLLLREAALRENGMPSGSGREMSRAAGYATTGLMAVAAGFALAGGAGAWILIPADAGDPFGTGGKPGTGQRAITLRTTDGTARCATGLSMRLLGPDGASLWSADTIMGQEVLPRAPGAGLWAEMTPADQSLVETWCIASLRRSVLLAVRASGLVQ